MHLTHKLALLAGLGLALTTVGYAPPAAARTHVSVNLAIGAPPPPRIERVPPPRAGYVWAPGYWRWNAPARRHVWVRGYWVQARPGYHYRPAHWERQGRGWRLRDGGWDR